ncbi:MAG: rRNA maturation RNase YbeY [Anaerolineae bacterium]|nr:rRNA maturation RNase YbeY [Anaerolineae bacterium]
MTNESAITIQNEKSYSIPAESLIEAAETVLRIHDAVHDELSIVITDNAEVQALNQQFRQIDAPTDVLSFPAEPLPDEFKDDTRYLGDLVIAYPYASEQAQRLNHNLEQSLMLLVVHGTLHLLGYDHDTPDNKAKMWAQQAEALTQLGVDLQIVPSLEDDHHV